MKFAFAMTAFASYRPPTRELGILGVQAAGQFVIIIRLEIHVGESIPIAIYILTF